MTQLASLLAGLFGGAGATLLWELVLRPKREQRSIAEILAAEVSLNLQILAGMIVRADAKRIPGDFHLSTYVFDAAIDRIGELPTDDVGDVVLFYNQLHDLNRKAALFWRSVDDLRALPADSPHRAIVTAELDSTIATFYGSINRTVTRANILQPRLLRAARPWWSLRRPTIGTTELLKVEEMQERAEASDRQREKVMNHVRRRTE
ncbi:MAG: hypothetical protein IPK33_11910 [Gemmatimonadetes bacterium]|nr:hypothetical protein [Gemmatimonadota bacterium]MBK9411009.1 hypothetical protein [Gemmatimonadota bacterium]